MTAAQCTWLLPLLVLSHCSSSREEDDRKRHHSGPIQASYGRYARPRVVADFSTVVLQPFLLLAPWEGSVGMQQPWEGVGGCHMFPRTDVTSGWICRTLSEGGAGTAAGRKEVEMA